MGGFLKKTTISQIFTACAVLILTGILFFPRYYFNDCGTVRLEDVISLAVFLLLLLGIADGKFKLYKSTFLPAFYFAYPFFTSLVRAAGAHAINFCFLIFWGKEFQYYAFFLLFHYLSFKNHLNKVFAAITLLVILNAAVGLYKIFTGTVDYYGIGAAFFENSPSLSGQVYFACSVFCLLMLNLRQPAKKHKIFLYCLSGITFICCLATQSKSSSFGILAFYACFYALSWLFMGKKPRFKVRILITSVSVSVIFLAFAFVLKNDFQPAKGLKRLSNPVQSTKSRYSDDLLPKLQKLKDPVDYVFGIGYLAGQNDEERFDFGSAYDSLYIRNILVLGIAGIMIWCMVLFYFARKLWTTDKRFITFYLSLLFSYLVMGIGLESFQLSKSGPVFWIITALLLGRVKREEQLSYEKDNSVLKL